MSESIPKISLVLPVHNEEGNLAALHQGLTQALNQAHVDYEAIFVDDGSTDNSLRVIKSLKAQDSKVNYISLSRNFGHQSALFAGLAHAGGDAVITLDADLQHPVSLIPKMISLWQQGAEVVFTTKQEDNLGWSWRLTMKMFYWFFSKISGLKLNFGQSDFRLIDKKVLQVILKIPDYHKFLRGQVEWVGFRQSGLSYKVDERRSGQSKFSYLARFPIALDGIFGFSKYPLRLITLLSIFIAAASLLYMFFVIATWLLYKLQLVGNLVLMPGWATIAAAVFFLGSIQLMAIGILGEYIGRTFDQTKGRPVFIIRESSMKELA